MKLAAVTTVRNECDIIESFVRHNAAFFDRIYILDHRSTDSTPAILRKLADEGLPVALSRADEAAFYQGPTMTRLIKGAVDEHPWDFVVPLDSDELVRASSRSAFESVLAEIDEDHVGLCEIVNYVPVMNDDANEPDVLRRIMHRVQTDPVVSWKIGTVVIPGAVVKQPGFALSEGQHGVRVDGEPVPEARLATLSLAHFPVRSTEQFTLRAILCRLAWGARSDYNPDWGWHYRTFVGQIKSKSNVSAADLMEAALLYVDIYLQPAPPHRKLLVRDPVIPAYQRLRFTNLVQVDVLPPIVDMMESLLDELGQARGQESQNGGGKPAASIPSSTSASVRSPGVRELNGSAATHRGTEQAIVFTTHIESSRIYRHFLRLRYDTRDTFDCFLCIHHGSRSDGPPQRLEADFRISAADEALSLPFRYAEKQRHGGAIMPGYVDLTYMPALLSPRLAAYRFIWLVEYDVDFAGNWNDFFMPLSQSRTDLLGSTIFPRSECPGWHAWRLFKAPPQVSERHQFRSFLPVVRFSRRMLTCYAEAIASGSWQGHTEAIYPTIASYAGLAIEDFGGFGPFVRPPMRGMNYINAPSPDGDLGHGTFIHRPAKQSAYFHESPERFPEVGYLHHPVKIAAD